MSDDRHYTIMKIYLIRHTSVDVPKGMCYGQSDVACAATFEQEAAEVKRRLEGLMFDKVFTSPLSRAVRLASFCGYPDAERDVRLMEMNMGDWEMQRWNDITDPYLQEWYNDYLHLPTAGGESFPQLRARVNAFMDELREKDYEHVAIFTHGGVVVSAGLYAGLFEEEECFSHQVGYGGLLLINV